MISRSTVDIMAFYRELCRYKEDLLKVETLREEVKILKLKIGSDEIITKFEFSSDEIVTSSSLLKKLLSDNEKKYHFVKDLFECGMLIVKYIKFNFQKENLEYSNDQEYIKKLCYFEDVLKDLDKKHKLAVATDLCLKKAIIKNEKLFNDFWSTYKDSLNIKDKSSKKTKKVEILVSDLKTTFNLKEKLIDLKQKIKIKTNDEDIIIRIKENGEKEVYS